MAKPPIDVERVVREVLAQLAFAPEVARDVPAKPAAGGPAEPPACQTLARQPPRAAPAPEDGERVVLRHVVTMAEVGDSLDGIRRLVVPPGAVVTPSVRDELRRKNVTLVYDEPVPAPSAGGARLVLMVLGSRFDPAPLVRALQNEGIDVRVRRSDCLIAATDALSPELGGSRTLGVLLSTCPAVALCLANRLRGVRAVWGIDAARAEADAASVGANLLVVDPGTTNVFQLRQMVGRFCRRGPAECPETLHERLQ